MYEFIVRDVEDISGWMKKSVIGIFGDRVLFREVKYILGRLYKKFRTTVTTKESGHIRIGAMSIFFYY